MSFSRAAIKRFNEPADNSIPPPGTYDPKFATDVGAIASNSKGGGNGNTQTQDGKLGRLNGNGSNVSYVKSRSEDTELLQQQQQQPGSGRISRDVSFSRRSITKVDSTTTDAGKRDLVASNKIYDNVKSRIHSRHSTSSTSSVSRNANLNVRKSPTSCTASSSKSSCAPANNTDRDPEVNEKTDENKENVQNSVEHNDKSSSKLNQTNMNNENDDPMCQEVIQEIQNMAQSLQVEVAEYKRRLSSEIIRCKELEAKKLELEFSIKSLMREIEKHESLKQSWEDSDIKQQTKIEDLNIKVAHLEQQLDDLEKKLAVYKDSEEILLEKAGNLESQIVKLQNEKLELQTTVEEVQRLMEREERKFVEAEEKCRELASQMESCYHVCENRTQEMENMKEVFEVRIQDLTQQKDDLLKELDSAKRELKTQKTLMELQKIENEEKEREKYQQQQEPEKYQQEEKPKHDDYIS